MKKNFSTILLCCIALTIFAQDTGLFLCKYTPTASGADVVFSRKKEAFFDKPGYRNKASTLTVAIANSLKLYKLP
jgi:hypothetical protein